MTQAYSVPASTEQFILCAARALADEPQDVPVRAVALFKDLLSATWLATGLATRIRIRALDAVIDSRPHIRSASTPVEAGLPWSP